MIHDHELRVTAFADSVTLVKIAPFEQRNLHDTKVIGTDDAMSRDRQFAGLWRRHPLNGKRGPKTSWPHGNALDDSGAGHDRIRLDGVYDISREHDVVLPFELVVWQRNAHRQDVARVKTGLDGQQARRAPE